MNRRSPQWASRLAAAASILFGSMALIAACTTDENPGGLPPGTGGTATAGAGGDVGETCDDGDVRECKVDLNEDNCFVGEQTCIGDAWGSCEEGTGTLALGGSSGCPSNPCNLGCNQFDETPMSPISPGAGAPPAIASGDPNALTTTWQDAAFNDNTHAQGSDCSSTGSCQLDHYCQDIASPQDCEPWEDGDFDATANFDLQIKTICDPANIVVCNRGGTTAPAGLAVTIWDPDPSYMDWNGNGLCTGLESVGAYHGSCLTPGTIAPGACIPVTGCGSAIGTTAKAVTINTPDQANSPWNLPYDSNEAECANNWSVYLPSVSCQCSSTAQQGGLDQVNMFISLDASGSMGGPAQGCLDSWCTDNWDSAVSGMTTFLQSANATGIRVAFRPYGDNPTAGCNSSACNENACADPLYGPDFLSNTTHRDNIVNWLGANSPGGGTPHQPAVGGACQTVETWASATFPGENNVVIYISDGQADSCGSSQATIAAEASTALANQGVQTFTVALPQSSLALMDAIAAAGGTGNAINLQSFSPGPALDAAMTQALVDIQNATASCNITIPNPSQVDPNAIIANYLAGGNPPGTPLNIVGSLGACSGANDEFYLDNPNSPTEVILCPATCTLVQADPVGIIDIVGGCTGNFGTVVQTFDYFATCGSAQGTRWDFLEYDTDVPGDATVLWEVSTGDTAAAAAAGPWTAVAQSTAANPDATPGSPIDLVSSLNSSAHEPYMELRITLTPTTSNASAPTVYDWNIKYSCLDNI
jgi:hypothetical protein